MSIAYHGKQLFSVTRIALTVICGFFLLFATVNVLHAVIPMPEIGVDYQSMKVENPHFLNKNGMSDVKKGDKVDLEFSQDGQLTIINSRSGERITVPLYERINDGM